MALPFSITRSVEVSHVSDPTSAADRLEQALESLRAKRIRRRGLLLEFTGGIFRAVSNHNLLVPISVGRLRVEPYHSGVRIRYRLEFTQLLSIVSVMMLLVFGPFVLSSPNLTWAEGASILLLFWLWAFGANVATTLYRFPRWLRRTAADGSHNLAIR